MTVDAGLLYLFFATLIALYYARRSHNAYIQALMACHEDYSRQARYEREKAQKVIARLNAAVEKVHEKLEREAECWWNQN
jgi:hypothetical protein